MSMTLEDLLRDLEKTASDQESEKKEEKAEKAEKEAEKKEDQASDKLKSAEKDLEEAKEKEERVKAASLQGAALAQEIMQKVASASVVTNKDQEMNKQAAFAGKALADSLLQKLAAAGDVTTTDGIVAGAAPNKAQVDAAQLVAEQNATIKPTPTTDAKGDNGGSINQIFDAIIADALAQGAATPQELNHQSLSATEGAVEAHAVPNGVPSEGVGEEVEKAAAVSALVNSGFDFDSAVTMVKAAEEEIMFEQDQQIKQAAMNELMASGVDFELAAAMVKQATSLGLKARVVAEKAKRGVAAVGAGTAERAGAAYAGANDYLGNEYANAAQNMKGLISGKNPLGAPGAYSRMDAARHLAHNRLVQGAGALGAAGLAAGGYALAREKQAAVNGLVDAGVDFDSAVELVNSKSLEIYGM